MSIKKARIVAGLISMVIATMGIIIMPRMFSRQPEPGLLIIGMVVPVFCGVISIDWREEMSHSNDGNIRKQFAYSFIVILGAMLFTLYHIGTGKAPVEKMLEFLWYSSGSGMGVSFLSALAMSLILLPLTLIDFIFKPGFLRNERFIEIMGQLTTIILTSVSLMILWGYVIQNQWPPAFSQPSYSNNSSCSSPTPPPPPL